MFRSAIAAAALLLVGTFGLAESLLITGARVADGTGSAIIRKDRAAASG